MEDYEDQWPTIQNDLVDRLIRFEKAISSYITEISKTKESKTVEEHLKDSSKEIKELFDELNEKILALSSEIERYTTWNNILFSTTVIFIELKIQKNNLRLLLRSKNNEINDPKNLTEIVPKSHGRMELTHIVYVDPKEINIKVSIDDIKNFILQSINATL